MYPQSMFLANDKKNIKKIHLKMNIFTAVKYCCILHGRVFVMKVSYGQVSSVQVKVSDILI